MIYATFFALPQRQVVFVVVDRHACVPRVHFCQFYYIIPNGQKQSSSDIIKILFVIWYFNEVSYLFFLHLMLSIILSEKLCTLERFDAIKAKQDLWQHTTRIDKLIEEIAVRRKQCKILLKCFIFLVSDLISI